MVNLNLIIFCLSVILVDFNASAYQSDLINFNVYRGGSKIFGHLNLFDSSLLQSNFSFDHLDSGLVVFDFVSGQPNTFDINGNVTVVEKDNGVVGIKAKAISQSTRTTVSFDTNVTILSAGHKLETQIDFNVTNTIAGTYSLELDLLDNCWPLILKHNLTTIPPELVSYKSAVDGYCYRSESDKDKDDNIVSLNALLQSQKWGWLNSTLDQYWSFNSTGGHEHMNATNPFLHVDVVADWVNGPVVKKRKYAIFTSKLPEIPSFRLSYLVDGEKKMFIYEPY